MKFFKTAQSNDFNISRVGFCYLIFKKALIFFNFVK